MLEWLMGPPLEVGSEAPDFSLPDEQGRMVRLSDLRGHAVVLLFYPGNDTPTCTQQLCAMRDSWPDFTAMSAFAFGVNGLGRDGQRKFAEKFHFPFPLLFDEGWKVTKLYRCGWGVARRTVYVIGPDGRIAFAQRGVPSQEQILGAIHAVTV